MPATRKPKVHLWQAGVKLNEGKRRARVELVEEDATVETGIVLDR